MWRSPPWLDQAERFSASPDKSEIFCNPSASYLVNLPMPFLESCDNKRVLSGQLIVTGIWATITVIGACLSPDPSGHGTHQQLGLPPCPSVLLFNRPCPGCGLTTSWTATIHGHFAEAFAAHPLGPILYGLLTLFAIINLMAF